MRLDKFYCDTFRFGRSIIEFIVKMERPDLADQRLFLIKQQNQFKVRMAELEDSILHKIATAEGDITEDRALIEGLENTKEIANDIEKKARDCSKDGRVDQHY